MDPKAVVEFLTETLRTHGPMLGAPLGGLLSKAFPSLRGSPGYSNLRTFIDRYCAGQIVRVDWNGSDFRFELADEESRRNATNSSPLFAAWGAFLKADLPIQVVVHTGTGELRTLELGEAI